jgi:hypothetical protein
MYYEKIRWFRPNITQILWSTYPPYRYRFLCTLSMSNLIHNTKYDISSRVKKEVPIAFPIDKFVLNLHNGLRKISCKNLNCILWCSCEQIRSWSNLSLCCQVVGFKFPQLTRQSRVGLSINQPVMTDRRRDPEVTTPLSLHFPISPFHVLSFLWVGFLCTKPSLSVSLSLSL